VQCGEKHQHADIDGKVNIEALDFGDAPPRALDLPFVNHKCLPNFVVQNRIAGQPLNAFGVGSGSIRGKCDLMTSSRYSSRWQSLRAAKAGGAPTRVPCVRAPRERGYSSPWCPEQRLLPIRLPLPRASFLAWLRRSQARG